MHEGCHACHRAGGADCEATFVCRACLRERNVCAFLPGGFDAFTDEVVGGDGECVLCEETRKTDEEWVDEWHRKR